MTDPRPMDVVIDLRRWADGAATRWGEDHPIVASARMQAKKFEASLRALAGEWRYQYDKCARDLLSPSGEGSNGNG